MSLIKQHTLRPGCIVSEVFVVRGGNSRGGPSRAFLIDSNVLKNGILCRYEAEKNTVMPFGLSHLVSVIWSLSFGLYDTPLCTNGEAYSRGPRHTTGSSHANCQ